MDYTLKVIFCSYVAWSKLPPRKWVYDSYFDFWKYLFLGGGVLTLHWSYCSMCEKKGKILQPRAA